MTTSDRPTSTAGKPSVLVVDDEEDVVEVLRFALEREGFHVISTHDGDTALELARKHQPSVALLDTLLPGRDGLSIVRALQAGSDTRGIYTIMISAKDVDIDVVRGLELGADDYVVKPFRVREVVARVRAVLRRRARHVEDTGNETTLRLGPLTIDRDRFAVIVDGEEVRVTLTEFKLLAVLASSPGRVFDRLSLLERAQGDTFVDERTVDVHVTAIRKKLGPHKGLIQTVRGVGYKSASSAGQTARRS